MCLDGPPWLDFYLLYSSLIAALRRWDQKRNRELESKVESNEARRQEIEMNLEKLMDQLKENRHEICEEQNKSRELRERFKM